MNEIFLPSCSKVKDRLVIQLAKLFSSIEIVKIDDRHESLGETRPQLLLPRQLRQAGGKSGKHHHLCYRWLGNNRWNEEEDLR
jgi:hypothetical protein